jgi:hypothetical protein
MAKHRVNAKIIVDGVEAGSEEEAVVRVAEIFSGTLIVVSATATKLSKTDIARRKQQG